MSDFPRSQFSRNDGRMRVQVEARIRTAIDYLGLPPAVDKSVLAAVLGAIGPVLTIWQLGPPGTRHTPEEFDRAIGSDPGLRMLVEQDPLVHALVHTIMIQQRELVRAGVLRDTDAGSIRFAHRVAPSVTLLADELPPELRPLAEKEDTDG